ncbi:MAG: DUF4157 domain-containing protein, partial [Ilumatobacteraceae bacterium]
MLKREQRRPAETADSDVLTESFEHVDDTATPVRRSMTIGRANDPAERQADRMADAALRNLGSYDDNGVSTINRRAVDDDPLGGTDVDPDVQRSIDAKRGGGRPLGDRETAAFSDSYGVDLSGVRVHTDSDADRLSRSLQADAFTTGNDVFFRRGMYEPGTSRGDQLIGHELAHVATEAGGASRSIHRFMTPAAFADLTSENWYTGKSRAQKAIEVMLAEYEELKENGQIPDSQLGTAISKIEGMITIAEAWKADHTKADGTMDANRAKRAAGFESFVTAARAQLTALKGRSSGSTNTAAMPEDARVKSLTEHYAGEGVSLFQRAGAALDMLLDRPNQEAEFKIELSIPIPPATIGGYLELKAERDDKGIEAKAIMVVSAGGSVGAAELVGSLGGYINAKGKDGAMVGSLMEYALYRRLAESNVPWEVEAYLFGGSASDRGKRRAEKRSLATETKAFGDPNDPNSGEYFAESGGLAELKAKAELGKDNSAEGVLQGSMGTRTDKDSLDKAKGGAGKANSKANSWLSTATRGAQETTGRSTAGFMAKAGIKIAGVSAEVEYKAQWVADNVKSKASNLEIKKSEIELAVEDIPMQGLVGDLGKKLITAGIDSIYKQITAAPEDQLPGDAATTLHMTLEGAKTAAEKSIEAATKSAAGKYEGVQSLGFAVAFNFLEKELTFKIISTRGQSVSVGVLSVEAKKKDTLLEIGHKFTEADAKSGGAGNAANQGTT